MESNREEFKLEVETRESNRELELKIRKHELLEVYGEKYISRIGKFAMVEAVYVEEP